MDRAKNIVLSKKNILIFALKTSQKDKYGLFTGLDGE